MRKMLAVLTILMLALAGCGGGEEEEGEEANAGEPCGTAPADLTSTPMLPAGFPTPDGVHYTKDEDKGPSRLVSGYAEGELDAVFEDFKSSLDGDGYAVTKDEKEEHDAEVAFEGGDSTGQVKLIQECEDRVSVAITARPE